MYILITAATSFEIKPTIDWLASSSRHETGNEFKTMISGIGSISTTYKLSTMIANRRPDLIVQAGIAGCFRNGNNGKVFAIREEILADMGVFENQQFRTIFDLGLSDPHALPFTAGRLINSNQELLNMANCEEVTAITVNEITTDPHRLRWYEQSYAPVVESMEGGAFHYVCLQERIPFLQIRSVSNTIGERDKSKWEFTKAIEALNSVVHSVLIRMELPFELKKK